MPGKAWAITSAAVASSSLLSRSARPVTSNPRVYQSWPRVRNSLSSTSHPGSPPFPFRTGHSFVRALAGLAPRAPLRGQQIRPRAAVGGHGLIVAGSHVSQTSRQIAALRARGATGMAGRRGAGPLRCPALRQPRSGPGPRRRRQPGHRPHGLRCPVPDRPAGTGRPARLGHRRGREHLPRRCRARPGHPPRLGGRPAVSRRDLGVPPGGTALQYPARPRWEYSGGRLSAHDQRAGRSRDDSDREVC